MGILIFLIIAFVVIVMCYVFEPLPNQECQQQPSNNKDGSSPTKLLDLDTTTVADRQRAYGRGYRMQLRYDILQRNAEITGDIATLEAIRTNTYDGPLPDLEEDDIPLPVRVKSRKPIDEPKVKRFRYFCIKDKGYHVSVWPIDSNNWLPGLDYVEFNIAGLTHRDKIDNYLGEHAGKLEAEPTNMYDPNAIKVLASDGHHVGYVPKNMTQSVRDFTPLPCKCYFYIGCSDDGTYFSDCYIKLNQ